MSDVWLGGAPSIVPSPPVSLFLPWFPDREGKQEFASQQSLSTKVRLQHALNFHESRTRLLAPSLMWTAERDQGYSAPRVDARQLHSWKNYLAMFISSVLFKGLIQCNFFWHNSCSKSFKRRGGRNPADFKSKEVFFWGGGHQTIKSSSLYGKAPGNLGGGGWRRWSKWRAKKCSCQSKLKTPSPARLWMSSGRQALLVVRRK